METGYETQRMDHLGIVAGVCEGIGLIEGIDDWVGPSKRKVTVGQAVQAMVLNALGFVGRALYLSPEFFHNKPLDLLIGEGVCAEDFNDDSLGRALDKLYEAGLTEGFAKLASKALRVHGIEHQFVHLDSTSFSLHGNYEGDEPQCIKVTQGYSKDQHPELKQVVVSLITSQRSAIPVWLETLSGNSSDKKSFVPSIEAYTEQLQAGQAHPYFVADSALYTADNLKALSQLHWISRVPETIKQAQQLLESVEPMQPLEQEGYACVEHKSDYGGIEQRWLVVYSKQAWQRQMKSFDKQLSRQQQRASKQLQTLTQRRFACREDAQTALAKTEKGWRYHCARVQIKELKHYGKKGRPKANDQPQSLSYQVTGSVVEDRLMIETACKHKGKFILATNQVDTQALSTQTIVSVYKEQGVSVERGFRFLKDPMFFADSLFLKRPQRLMALLMVMGLSLLIYALAERKLRQALKHQSQSIPNQLGKPTRLPTMRRIFQVFEGIDVLLIIEAGKILQRRILNLLPIHSQIIDLLGPRVQKCYFL